MSRTVNILAGEKKNKLLFCWQLILPAYTTFHNTLYPMLLCIWEKYQSLLGSSSEYREPSNELVILKQDSSCTRYF